MLGSPEVEVVGVTTTYGNSLSHLTYRDARRLLALCGRPDIPVLRGASSLARDPRPTPASRFLLDTISRHRGEITLLTLGPLTNLHAALTAWPGLARHVRQLVVMGGRTESGLKEFNFSRDPAAADAVMSAGIPTVEIPFDLIFCVVVTQDHVARLQAAEGSVVSTIAWRLDVFASAQDRFRALQGRVPGQAEGGFHPWDVVAAAWLVAPQLFGAIRDITHRVDSEGRSQLAPWVGDGEPVRMPGWLDAPGFLSLFLERVVRPRVESRR